MFEPENTRDEVKHLLDDLVGEAHVTPVRIYMNRCNCTTRVEVVALNE